ncbi:MAG TPA: DUF2512 family protein [Syntrophomonadaceae bacterium]|nr:DUF2512 family protein [Syntrophomonadaceae bacterium]
MNTWLSLIGKYIYTFIAAYLTFALVDGIFILAVALIALVGAAANYLIGDQAIMPNYGNVIAAVANGLIAGVLAYITILLWPALTVSFTSLAFFTIIIAIAEYFFHLYLESGKKIRTESE